MMVRTYLLQVKGQLTKNENIADNGGAEVSYRAYNRWEKDHGLEPQLPGLNYTSQQMFWISMASSRCTKIQIKSQKFLILSDEHAPPVYRIIGSLSNSDSFARDFSCPEGSKMNPKNKCRVW